MTGQGIDSKKRIDTAQLRLAEAIGRLESAIDRQSNSSTVLESEISVELNRLKNENIKLKELFGETSSRLDVTIENLKDQMVLKTKGQA